MGNFKKNIGVLTILFSLLLATNTYAGGSNYKKSKDKKSKDSQSKDSQSYDNGSNDNNGGDSVPLDGGLGILLIGAAAFGASKLRDNKKQ